MLDPKNNTPVEAKDFESDEDAIAHAQALAKQLGNQDLIEGSVIVVCDEDGNIIKKIAIVRQHG